MTLQRNLLALAVLLMVAGVTPAFAQAPAQAEASAKPTPPTPSALPVMDLSPELLYKMMLAEIALQRGLPQTAVQTLLEVVRETRDPRVAQRATEVAWNARMRKEALEAAGLWLKIDPHSARALEVVAALLVNQESLAEAKAPLEQWMVADKANVGRNFVQIAQLLARHKDKKAAFDLLRGLARPYNNIAEVRLAVAQAAWNANDVEAALVESRAALNIKPDHEVAVLFHVQRPGDGVS